MLFKRHYTVIHSNTAPLCGENHPWTRKEIGLHSFVMPILHITFSSYTFYVCLCADMKHHKCHKLHRDVCTSARSKEFTNDAIKND